MENKKVRIINIDPTHYKAIRAVLGELKVFNIFINSAEYLFIERDYTKEEIKSYNLMSRMGFEYAIKAGILSKTVKEIDPNFIKNYARDVYSEYERYITSNYENVIIFININPVFFEEVCAAIESCADKVLDCFVNSPSTTDSTVEIISKDGK